jgi:hypothetical protein
MGNILRPETVVPRWVMVTSVWRGRRTRLPLIAPSIRITWPRSSIAAHQHGTGGPTIKARVTGEAQSPLCRI